MNISEKLEKLRSCMKENGIDVYYIPTNDYHSSEYVGDFFKCREYISGFTGSAGTVVVTETEAGLWTDGRYFIQAENQLKDTGITLYKNGLEGVPGIKKFITDKMRLDEEGGEKKGKVLGFDGRCVSFAWAADMKESIEGVNGNIVSNVDLVGDIWEDRPVLKSKPVMSLDVKYAGQSREDKIKKLREYMKSKRADYHGVPVGSVLRHSQTAVKQYAETAAEAFSAVYCLALFKAFRLAVRGRKHFVQHRVRSSSEQARAHDRIALFNAQFHNSTPFCLM